MVYFDNSASTLFKPPQVIASVSAALTQLSANPGRSSHRLAAKTALAVYRTRKNAAAFLGCTDERLIFTSGCTESLNLAIFGMNLHGEVITTTIEHNSMLRPLYALNRRGRIKLRFVNPRIDGLIYADDVLRMINRRTALIAINHISNVTGAISPITEIAERKGSIPLLVDGAQSVGYHDITINKEKIDMLAVAPHKGLYSPQGIGLLAIGKNLKISPLKTGGTGILAFETHQPEDYPEHLECGTLPTPAILGLNAGLSYVKRNKKQIRDRIATLGQRLYNGLLAIKDIKVYSPIKETGIIAFNVGHLPSNEVGDILSEKYDICVRTGLHCAPLLHAFYNTQNQGMVRVSIGCDNTESQIDYLLNAIEFIAHDKLS